MAHNKHDEINPSPQMNELAEQIGKWALKLGFQNVGFSRPELPDAEVRLQNWITAGRHGDMSYMMKHGTRALDLFNHAPAFALL